MRKRTFARSDGLRRLQVRNASRAAPTARATSFWPACATSASGSSVDGEIVVNQDRDRGETCSPPMKRPYRRSSETISRASSDGA